MTADEYAAHDALGLRELLATREVSAAEIEAAARRALEAANAHVNGLAAAPFEPALEHAERRPALRRPVPDQGLRADGPGRAVLLRQPRHQRHRGRPRQRPDDPHPRRRAGHPRPHHRARAGGELRHRTAAHRPDPQPVGPLARRRRLQRRIRPHWSRPAPCRSRTATMAPARSASRPPAAASSASSPPAAASRRGGMDPTRSG